MIKAGQDPLQQAIDQAHAKKQPFWMYLRPQAYTADARFTLAFAVAALIFGALSWGRRGADYQLPDFARAFLAGTGQLGAHQAARAAGAHQQGQRQGQDEGKGMAHAPEINKTS